MRRTALLGWFVCLLMLVSSCSGGVEQPFVDDRAGLLSDSERQRINAYHRALQDDFAISCKLIILDQPSDDINRTAAALFSDLGRQSGGARGLLFLVDPVGRQVRIEVGYDLEGVFPDGFVGYLERRQLAPFFQHGRVGSGIEATTELFIVRAQQDAAGFAYDPALEQGPLDHYSGGGGARLDVEIGSAPDRTGSPVPTALSRYRPGATPEQSLAVYRQVLADKIKDPHLPLYTPATREFLARWVVTDAQQDNELRSLEQAVVDMVVMEGSRAVIRFAAEARTRPPYFLELRDAGWELDFAAMNRILRMNHQNQWHFPSLNHEYLFGFTDWEFDANGFPLIQR